jgi:hypothetical protein
MGALCGMAHLRVHAWASKPHLRGLSSMLATLR